MKRSFHNREYSQQHDESIDKGGKHDVEGIDYNYESARSQNEGNPTVDNSQNATKIEEDSADGIYSYQVKTRRFAILLIILGLIIMLLGYSAMSYDMIELKKANVTGRYEYTIKSDSRDPNLESKSEQDQSLTFDINKYTFLLLAGLSTLTDTLTCVEGILVLYLSIKAVVSIQNLINQGQNIFKPNQGKTRNIYDAIMLMAVIQLISSIVYSAVLLSVLHKATNQFEKRQQSSDNSQQAQLDEIAILKFENIIVTRSAITIIFFSLGCFLHLMILRQFKNYQKKYEDFILEKVDETYRLGQSQKVNAIIMHQ